MKEQKKGISLIVLVITIIVMLILASAVIITLSNSNIINKAKEAVNKTDVKNFDQELSLSLADMKLKDASYGIDEANAATVQDMKKYIPDFTDKYYGKLIVQNGKLAYVKGNVTEEEKLMFESIGIDAGSYITVAKAEEIKALAEKAAIDSTVSSTEVTTYIENMPAEYAYLFTIHEGKMYYRYEKATYDERVSLHAAGIPFLIGDVNADGLISEEDEYLIYEFEVSFDSVEWPENIYYIADVNFDYYIDSTDGSCISESLTSTQENATKYTDLINLNEQNPAKIQFIGDYRKVYYNSFMIDKQNTNDYREIMKCCSTLTEKLAKKFTIIDYWAVYRYETLTAEEFNWITENAFEIGVAHALKFSLGDGNFDGLVDDKDLEVLTNITLGETATAKQQVVLDINGDGTIDNLDKTTLSAYLTGTGNYASLISNYYEAKVAN